MKGRLGGINELLDMLADYKGAGLFNPWSETCVMDVDDRAHLERRRRLREHLAAQDPAFILVGEAGGYQGCRYSGIAFTS